MTERFGFFKAAARIYDRVAHKESALPNQEGPYITPSSEYKTRPWTIMPSFFATLAPFFSLQDLQFTDMVPLKSVIQVN